MSDKNMRIWDQVEKTDPEFTDFINQRGGFTAIDAMYQSKRATKLFGAYGAGWGLESSEIDASLIDSLGMVIHKAVFFYITDGNRFSFPISNAIQAVKIYKKKDKDGNIVSENSVPDVDFAKKLETNTISKALSRLGFSADIFMGMFEDADYKTEIDNEFKVEKADDKIAERERQQAEYEALKAELFEQVANALSVNELAVLYKRAVRKLTVRGDQDAIKYITSLKDDVKAKLEDSNNG